MHQLLSLSSLSVSLSEAHHCTLHIMHYRCCGVSQNTYHTLKDMRVVFVDGTVLDTADPKSCESFMQVCVVLCVVVCLLLAVIETTQKQLYCVVWALTHISFCTPATTQRTPYLLSRTQTHKALCDGVVDIARRVQNDQQLTSLIRRKFAIKCTTGECVLLRTSLIACMTSGSLYQICMQNTHVFTSTPTPTYMQTFLKRRLLPERPGRFPPGQPHRNHQAPDDRL